MGTRAAWEIRCCVASIAALEYFITFPSFMVMIGRASDSIDKAIIVHTVLILPKVVLKLNERI